MMRELSVLHLPQKSLSDKFNIEYYVKKSGTKVSDFLA